MQSLGSTSLVWKSTFHSCSKPMTCSSQSSIGFIVAGDLIGRGLEMPGTGMVFGFLVALFGILAWPWVLPESLDNWMHDTKA